MCEAVFRTTSSGALPVLANTVFRFWCKTNRKQYILAPTGVPGERPQKAFGSTGVERALTFSDMDRQALSERSFLAIWDERRRANAYF